MNYRITCVVFWLAAALATSLVSAQTSAPPIVVPRTFTWDSASNPDNVFWPSISWWWNGPLDSDTLQSQLEDMKAHDVRNTLVFPFYSDFRPGNYHMDPDYLTEGYMNRVQVVVDKAAEVGMNIWLNADGGWPIGYALRDNPQYATQYATYQLVYSNGTWTEQRNPNAYVNADLLSSQTTAALLSTTYQPYIGTLGSQLGQTVQFMVTDEAAYQYISVGNSIPWTPGGRALFQSRFGYDVLANNKLDAFAVSPSQLSTAQKQVRVDVIDFVSGQMRDSYFIQSRDWCREHGMAQIGRLGGEDETMGAVQYGFGSVMRQLRAVDAPGIDAIWRQIFPGQSNNGNFPKYASSAAHQNGTAIVTSLSFPVYGEGLTPAQMKWIIDYQFVRGVTQYATESYPVSTQDDLITDLRPQWNTSPLWDYMPDFHRYTARVGYLMSCGQPAINTGLYYPVRDIWANADSSDPAVVGFDALSQKLLERQCDYDIIDDDILNDPSTRVENGRLVLGAMSYGTIVVGPTQWMTETAQQRLNAFEKGGGQVVRINSVSEINSAIAGIKPTIDLSGDYPGIRAAGRRWDGGGVMYLFNEGQSNYNGVASLELAGKPYQFDPVTGVTRKVEYTALQDGRISVPLNLAAGESLVLVAQPLEDTPPQLAPADSREIIESLALADGWTARVDRQYVVGERDYEIHETGNTQFHPVALGRWATTLGLTSDFSGHVTYQRKVEIPESMRDGRLLLNLGGMEYAARVKVDGQEVGRVLWSPWTIEMPSLGDRSEFLLEVEISNTLANELTSQRVRDLWGSKTGPGWPDSYNERQWPFEMESRGGGLLGPVSLNLVGSLPVGKPFWMTPSIYDHSPDQGGTTVNLLVDGNTTNLAKLMDDSPPADDSDFIVSGYVVFDLGSKQKVLGWKYWSRSHTRDLGPKDIDFFYWNDEDVNAHAFTPNTSDQIGLDTNVVIAASRSLPGVNSNNFYEMALTMEEQFEARYVGIRINTGYDTPSYAAIHMAEVQFYTISTWLPGDANHDGRVDAADAGTMAANWLGSGKAWRDGDFNGDGRVDDLDAALLAANWTGSLISSTIPEPHITLMMTMIAILCGFRASLRV